MPAAGYNQDMSSFYEVMIERNFSSAHQLRGYKGKCENLHGHNYKIEIYARGEELNNIGLLIDFGDLKAAADEVVKYLDHRNINELPPFDEELNPSAENLAKWKEFFFSSDERCAGEFEHSVHVMLLC
jgi:6-pyruvoyltetrahydropterin/6-carboxytetrahydropterin synthase